MVGDGERRELVGPVEPAAGVDDDRASGRRDERAIAVIFDLVEPAVAARHRIDEGSKLERAEFGRLARRRGGPGALFIMRRRLHLRRKGGALRALQRLFAARVARDLGHGAAGEDTGEVTAGQFVAAAGIGVVDLSQQPVLALLVRARLHAYEQPFAFHPFAVEGEMQVAFVDVLRALAFDRCPGTAIPQHHRAAAIFALGDRALEIGIGHRMTLGPHRKPLVGGIGARPRGHRPALEHAVRLEPEIVMEPCRVMLLDDEAVPRLTFLAFRDLARGFGGQLEIALLPIWGEGVGAGH